MPRELTTRFGNPAHAIRARYDSLMGIDDPDTLVDEARKAVDGTQFSPANRRKFETTLMRERANIDRLRSFLTNFILKADGHGVI